MPGFVKLHDERAACKPRVILDSASCCSLQTQKKHTEFVLYNDSIRLIKRMSSRTGPHTRRRQTTGWILSCYFMCWVSVLRADLCDPQLVTLWEGARSQNECVRRPVCALGTGYFGSAADLALIGATYVDVMPNSNCVVCPTGYYSDVDDFETPCIACPANSSSSFQLVLTGAFVTLEWCKLSMRALYTYPVCSVKRVHSSIWPLR